MTLDELVHGEDVPKTEPVPAPFTPQATPEREKHHTIAGTALLCTGAVILVLCLLLAGDLFTGLLFASPFLICGIICFAVKQRTGLYCGWAVYLCVDFYLRFATGVSWMTIFMTHLWTYEMNYMCLAIAWVQFFAMLVMIVCTMRAYHALKLSATKKEVTWLLIGWLAALVVLPLLIRCGIMPLTYSKFSPYFFINVLYSYVRLALVNVLLVRTLAIWRVKREAKKANRNATET